MSPWMPWSQHQKKMAYSEKTIHVLIGLRDGEQITKGVMSSSRQLLVLETELARSGAISFGRKGKLQGYYKATDRERFLEVCGRIDPSLSDLDAALLLAQGLVSTRSEKVTLFGNSKQERVDRTIKGFTILADRIIDVEYLGRYYTIGPLIGLHVVDRTSLKLPEYATVIIVENAECLYDLKWIPNVGLKEECGPYVVLCRFPVCEEAKLWMKSIPNRLLYFGDFDLAGIRIYETEFKKRLAEKISFIVPEDLEERIRKDGNPELYSKQVNEGFVSVTSPSGELSETIDLLHRLQSSFEQEGYCVPFPYSQSKSMTTTIPPKNG